METKLIQTKAICSKYLSGLRAMAKRVTTAKNRPF